MMVESSLRRSNLSRRSALGATAAGGAALLAAACTDGGGDGGSAATAESEATATTLGLPAGEETLGEGSFSLFAQSDMNFQTLFALGGPDRTQRSAK